MDNSLAITNSLVNGSIPDWVTSCYGLKTDPTKILSGIHPTASDVRNYPKNKERDGNNDIS